MNLWYLLQKSIYIFASWLVVSFRSEDESLDKASDLFRIQQDHQDNDHGLDRLSANAGTPIAYMEVVIACITSAPIMLASREKRPPAMDVPPITTARMASSSRLKPMLLASEVLMFELATSPAIPAQKPQNV